MYKDIHVGGVLITSFVVYALGAFAILMLLRSVFAWIRLGRFVANPPLAEAGVYVCLLGLLILVL